MADKHITQTITPLPDVAGRFDADFIETADKFLNALPKNAEELNTFIAQFNELLKFVNTASAAAIAAQNVMGAWDSSVEYKHPCTVFYNNRRYASLQDSLGKQPDTETDYWLLIDGEGSNLDADTVDGKQASDLANYDLSNTDDSVVATKVQNVTGTLVKLATDEVVKQDNSWIKNQITAFLAYDGVNNSILDNYNFASIVRNGDGDYDVTFENEMDNANYVVVFGTDLLKEDDSAYVDRAAFVNTGSKTITGFTIRSGYKYSGTDHGFQDMVLYVAVLGGKQ